MIRKLFLFSLFLVLSCQPVSAGWFDFFNAPQNKALMGPSSGGSGSSTWRSIIGADLPNPSASTLGGIESYVAVSHQWINTISTSGIPSSTQPACGDLSNAVASCSTDATNASNISSGTLALNRGGTGQTTNTAAFDALAPSSPVKGDILVYSGTHWVRLPVGADTFVVTANSAATNGVDWEASGGGGGGSNFTVTAVSSNITLADRHTYDVDTTAARTLTLPSPVSGIVIEVKDTSWNADINPITVAQSASEKIENVAASFVMHTKGGLTTFYTNGTDWFIK